MRHIVYFAKMRREDDFKMEWKKKAQSCKQHVGMLVYGQNNDKIYEMGFKKNEKKPVCDLTMDYKCLKEHIPAVYT